MTLLSQREAATYLSLSERTLDAGELPVVARSLSAWAAQSVIAPLTSKLTSPPALLAQPQKGRRNSPPFAV
jgi:hypothetical protein